MSDEYIYIYIKIHLYHRGRPFVGDMTTNNAKLTHNVNQYAKGNRLHYQNMKLTMFCAIPNTLRTFLYIHVCVCVCLDLALYTILS